MGSLWNAPGEVDDVDLGGVYGGCGRVNAHGYSCQGPDVDILTAGFPSTVHYLYTVLIQ